MIASESLSLTEINFPGWLGGWLVGESKNKTNSAKLELELGWAEVLFLKLGTLEQFELAFKQSVSPFFVQCFNSVSSLFHQCFTNVSTVFQHCLTIVSPVFYLCFTSVSTVFHLSFTTVSPVF